MPSVSSRAASKLTSSTAVRTAARAEQSRAGQRNRRVTCSTRNRTSCGHGVGASTRRDASAPGERRASDGAGRVRARAAIAERAAGRELAQAGHRAGDGLQLAARAGRRPAAESRPSALGYMDGAASPNTSSTLPCSTMCPPYSTSTRWQTFATTGRSCVISSRLDPCFFDQLDQQLQDLGLHGDVERGRRLVGDQNSRARTPWPWRSSRAGAGRPKADADRRASSRPRREV